jgi:enoyl-CoA hydratase/carnithine racemase
MPTRPPGSSFWPLPAIARSRPAQILPREDFDAALSGYLRRFTGRSSAAMRLGRRQLRSLLEPSMDDQLTELSGRLMDESIALEDYAEGVGAFLQKRKPVWRHR